MNTYTKKAHMEIERGRQVKGKDKGWLLPMASNCIVLIVLVFCALFLRMKFSDKTEALTRQAEKLNMEISDVRLEIGTLRNRHAELTSRSYIEKRIKQYNLRLRPTSHNQITYVKRYTPENAKVGDEVVARTEDEGSDVAYNK